MYKLSNSFKVFFALVLFILLIWSTYLAFSIDKLFYLVMLFIYFLSTTAYCLIGISKRGTDRIFIKNGYLVIDFTQDSVKQRFYKNIHDILKIEILNTEHEYSYRVIEAIIDIKIEDRENNIYNITFKESPFCRELYISNFIDIFNKKIINNKPYKHLLLINSILHNYIYFIILYVICMFPLIYTPTYY